MEELKYQIALGLVPGVGPVVAKKLLGFLGSASAVFKANDEALLSVPTIGAITCRAIQKSRRSGAIFKVAEEEIKFMTAHGVQPIFYTDAEYPRRLLHCEDSPILLFWKGKTNLNVEKVVGVVGTRQPTDYGKELTRKLIEDLKLHEVLVVSGLAYGIDAFAHKSALDNDLQTVGILGHGLDRLYPPEHEQLSKRMLGQGGLLSEFLSGNEPEKMNFPKRNRIVAGMCDALIVVESKKTGGALITADMAMEYGREVFSFPGRAGDEYSEGCNRLIRENKAGLIESAQDVVVEMNWELGKKAVEKKKCRQMEFKFSEEESALIGLLEDMSPIHFDELCSRLQLSSGKASGLLLQLEFCNIVRAMPGKLYALN